jgi:hypothetical protein
MINTTNIIVIVFIISTIFLLAVSYSEFSLNLFSARICIWLKFDVHGTVIVIYFYSKTN